MAEDLSRMREQVYKDPRPPEHFARFHERTRTREPDLVYPIVRAVTGAWGLAALRARALDVDRVPGEGACILAPNHFSFMDHFLLGLYPPRRVQFMAKSQLFKPPAQWIYTHGGVFPVRRGHRDEEAFLTARTILERGGVVAMYPEAGRSRTGQLGTQARPGIGRLVLESGAPVLPVAIHGSSKVRNWKRLQSPKVTVHYGEPMYFEREAEPSRERQQEVADAVFAGIRVLYEGLETLGRRGAVQRIRAQRKARRRAKRAAPAA